MVILGDMVVKKTAKHTLLANHRFSVSVLMCTMTYQNGQILSKTTLNDSFPSKTSFWPSVLLKKHLKLANIIFHFYQERLIFGHF